MQIWRSGTSVFRVGAAVFAALVQTAFGQVNVLTQHNDIGRTGQNTNETILTAQNVSSGNFGKLFSVAVDGQVYSQPLYVSNVSIPGAGTHNVVYAATMHDSVYAFDADTPGAPLWQVTMLDSAHGASAGATSDPISTTNCTQLAASEVGIMGTPVIDATNGTIYVVSRSFENSYPVQRLHALDITTGAEKLAPVTLSASVAGTGGGSSNGKVSFDPKIENQRAGLLLLNGIVYVAFGSFCEAGAFHGWVLAYNGSTLAQTSVFVTTPNGTGSGIWMAGAGLAADVPAGSPFGRMFLATGNGTYDATTPYTTNQADYGDDVLQLDLTNGVMKVTDAFTPLDQASMQANNADLGSGGVMLLPDSTLAGHPHQMLAGGKTANLYLIDRDSLGGYSTTANNIIEYIAPPQISSLYGAPAYWNNHVYYWGNSGYLTQFDFTNGLMNGWHLFNSAEKVGFPGSIPAVSSNGITNGIVWSIDPTNWQTNGSANLMAHDALNVSSTLYNSATNATRDNPGPAVKFAVPTIANGKVYVAGYGQLSVFGLLSAPDFTLAAAQTNVSIAQGSTASDVITVGAINGFSGVLTLTASGLPAGMTTTFASGLTLASRTVSFSVASSTALGTYPVIITGNSGTGTHSLTINVTVTTPAAPLASFTLTAGPRVVAVVQGQSGTTSIAIVAVNGFDSAVTLTSTGLPTGVTATFSPVAGGTSTLTLTSASNTPAGIYPFSVQGTGGGVASAVNLTLMENNLGETNVLTQHNDIGRTGQNVNETILTPANVSGGNFGKLFSVPVDGQVYAQPLYVSNLALPNAGTHNVAFVVTMHDSVYAFDADTQGAPLWQVSLLDAAHGAAAGATSDPVADVGCDELLGTEIGIMSTPVIDPATGVIYVVGRTFENGYAVERLHALDITSGAEIVTPATLSAAVAGTGVGSVNGILTFDPKWENQRTGLLLVNGIVYMSFASYCDNGPFHGWVLAYDAKTLTQTSVFTPTPNGTASGIWMSGTGLAADIPPGSPFGRMFVATGNGTYDAVTPYTTNIADYGDDVIQLDLTNGVMHVTDAFTPMDQAALEAADKDLSSGGIILLPDQTLAGHTHQLISAGKTGNIYIVDRDSLGGYSTTANNIIKYISPPQIGGLFSVPAYWNNHIYIWSLSGTLSQFDFTNGLMNSYHLQNSTERLTFPGSTPSVSANGTTNGIVWNVNTSAAKTNGDADLLAHDATNVAITLYSSAANHTRDNPGPAVKFAVPTITNGKVYVAAYGQLSVYGLLSGSADFTLTAAQPGINVVAGGNASSNLTVTALNGFTGTVTLSASGLPNGLTAAFTAGSTAGTTVVTLTATGTTAAGTYPVVFTGVSGSLTHSTTVSVTVSSAAAPSFTLTATPATLAIVQGQAATSAITVVPANGFTGAVTFAASGLPSGLTATFSGATISITAAASATPGTYSVIVSGTSGSLSAATNVSVTVTAQAAFSLTAGSVSVKAGQSGTAAVSVTPANGFSGTVAFSIAGLPSGVTGSFSPASSTTASTLTLTTSSTAVPGSYSVTVTGVSGSVTASTTLTLVIGAAPTFSLNTAASSVSVPAGQSGTLGISVVPANGFSSAIAFSLSGLPAGVSGSFSPASSATASTLTLTASGATASGTSVITVTGVSGNTSSAKTFTLVIAPAPAFSLTAAANSVTVVGGKTGTVNISVSGTNGFTGAVTFSAASLPAGVTAVFSPGSSTTGSTLTLTAASTAAAGSYSFAVNGVSGSLSASKALTLVISAAPDFKLALSSSSVTLARSLFGYSAGTDTITISALNGFSGSVALSVTGAPGNFTTAFSPASLTTAGTSKLTLTPGFLFRRGSYTLTITAKNGTLTHTATLTVVAP